MSIIKADAVREAALSAGIKTLKEDVANSLAQDAEYRLREIVQEALKFKRHSRRKRLTVSDINNALRVRNVEPLYGFSLPDPIVYGTRTAPDGTEVCAPSPPLPKWSTSSSCMHGSLGPA